MIKIFFFLLLNFTLICSAIVKVGAYPFPPYLNINDKVVSGKIVDVISLLNKIQSDFKFELVLTSPDRRYIDLGNKFDLMFFEDLNWNWGNKDIEKTEILLKDEEVFITLSDFYTGKDFFSKLENKKILVIKGFHYAFANYNSDPEYLNKNFKVVFSTSPENTLEFLFKKRAEIAIITKSFLTQYLKKFPDKKNIIIINEIPDQTYNLTFIKSKNAPITLEKLNLLVEQLKKNQNFQDILKK